MQDQSNLKVLQLFGINQPKVLGRGREGTVYSLDKDKVVKIFTNGNPEQLKEIQQLYELLASFPLPYQTPNILKIGEIDGVIYTLEKRLLGKPLDQLFLKLRSDQKKLVLRRYFEAIIPINTITLPDKPYGQIIKTEKTITDAAWSGFLLRKLAQKINEQPFLRKDVKDFDRKVEILKDEFQNKVGSPVKSLVHGDYYFTNVLVNDKLEVSAVLDFGEHAVVGDKRMDVAGAISFLTAGQEVIQEHVQFLTNLALSIYGKDIIYYIALYTLFYAFYFAKFSDKDLYKWSLRHLNDTKTWLMIDKS